MPLIVIEAIWLTASALSASSVASEPPVAGSPTRSRLAVGAGRNSLRRTGSIPPWSTPSISGSAMSRSALRRMRTLVRVLAGPSEVMVSRLVESASRRLGRHRDVGVRRYRIERRVDAVPEPVADVGQRCRVDLRRGPWSEVDRHERRAVYADLEPGARRARAPG